MKKKTPLFRSTLLLIASLTLPLVSPAQDGSLDLSFDTDGIVVTPISINTSEAKSIALQNDGKIVVAGNAYNGNDDDFAVVRYNADGSLDNTFDTDGIVVTDINGSIDYARSVAIQSDGKIVVAGSAYNGNNDDFAVVRYNTDGSLDNTFDTDGIVVTDISDSTDNAFSIAIQSDGKIVVGGSAYNGNDDDFAVVRYNIDGSLDNIFDTDGIVLTDINNASPDFAYSIAIQSDGGIVASGSTFTFADNDFAVVRYNINGNLDNTFDIDGIVVTPVGFIADNANSIAIQSDGKIVVVGHTYNSSSDIDFAVTRYNTDGSLDNTFDTDGIVLTDINNSFDYANSIAIQSDGKILVAGFGSPGSNFDFIVTRYNTNGSLDNTFDSDGIDTTDISDLDNSAFAIAVQSDGKILVAGSVNNISSIGDFAVIRYNATSTGINTVAIQTSELVFYPNPFST